MRQQYHFRPSKKGLYAWDINNLIELSKNFPVQEVDISSIKEINENWWYQKKNNIPNAISIAEHMQLVNETNLEYPIILCEKGRLMDGMHRLIKALLEKKETIKMVKFTKTPNPEYKDISPDDLPYNDSHKKL